jgi:Zn-dependent protease
MPGGRSIQLGKVFGIRIGLHPSWFLALFWFIWVLTGYYQDAILGSNDSGAFLLATASALLFFGSILLHELGHALVAIRNKVSIAGIELWMFGGIASMTRDSGSAGVEFRIAAAGPAVTVLIAAACSLIGILAGGAHDFWEAMRGKPQDLSNSLLAVLAYLTTMNILLLLFNLVPAFPLDGGRIARSLVWAVTGDRTKATRFAAGLGRLFSYVLIGAGVFFLLQGALTWAISFIFIGMFLGQAARAELYHSAVRSSIEGIKVADIMDAEPVAVPGEASVAQALDEYFLRYRWPWFPVVDGHGYFIGLVERERAEQVAEQNRPIFTVREIMRPDEKGWRVRLDDPLEAVLGSEPFGRIGALMAVDAEGHLRGVVTVDHVRRALQHGVS